MAHRNITTLLNGKSTWTVLMVALAAAMCWGSYAYANGGLNNRNGVRRVLLISIDGMHAVDYDNCVTAGTCPTLTALGKTGVNFPRTSTSKPSDSAPGLAAIVTGGSPRTVGVFYDVAFDRVLAPPQNDTGNGVFGGDCIANQANGTTTEYEEGVDIDQTQLNGGFPGYSLLDGGFKSIDPTRLPRDPFNLCQPVYPWNFLRTNTIYGVIHAAGGYTAWSDKHAVYASVSGPTGTATPSNVDDYYSPDVNSNIISLPNVVLPDGTSCNPLPDPAAGGAWTDSFQNIKCYDTLKVNAVVNWIKGKTHLGDANAPVPVIFGMNFQAVSVGQKLIQKIGNVKVKGGYTNAAGTPTAELLGEIQFVDASLGLMVNALKAQGLLDSTLIIITAKHGQSPIDPNRFQEEGSGIATTPADVLVTAPNNFLPPPPAGGAPENPNTPSKILGPNPPPPFTPNQKLDPIGPTQDDVSLLWLATGASVTDAVNALEASGTAGIGLGQIFYGASLETMFNAPGVPKEFGGNGGDPRTPDIIVQPNVGVIYTTSGKKQAEHGGFAHDDTNVILLVSKPGLPVGEVTSFVETAQVAPTILQALGLDPGSLEAVQQEGTPVLPGLNFK